MRAPIVAELLPEAGRADSSSPAWHGPADQYQQHRAALIEAARSPFKSETAIARRPHIGSKFRGSKRCE
jgi:hypothetical protein